jgi:hypothetical protein
MGGEDSTEPVIRRKAKNPVFRFCLCCCLFLGLNTNYEFSHGFVISTEAVHSLIVNSAVERSPHSLLPLPVLDPFKSVKICVNPLP